MKIFVTGFQRSGTTLLKDLIGKHPDVKHIFHEVALLRFPKKKLLNSKFLPDKKIRNNFQGVSKVQYHVDFNLKTDNWGEKLPFWTPKVGKGYGKFITKYCRQWNEYFGDQARILHIVRHPMDVAISTRRRGFTKSVMRPIKVYKQTMPVILQHFQTMDNLKHVQFERILINPLKILTDIYTFCGLDSSRKTVRRIIKNKNIFRFKKINSKRAYAYERDKVNIKKFNLRGIMIHLNQLEGIQYKLPGVKYAQKSLV